MGETTESQIPIPVNQDYQPPNKNEKRDHQATLFKARQHSKKRTIFGREDRFNLVNLGVNALVGSTIITGALHAGVDNLVKPPQSDAHTQDFDAPTDKKISENIHSSQSTNETKIVPIVNEGISNENLNKLLSIIPEDIRENAKTAIPLLAKALKDQNLYSENVLAYMLAVVEHESLDFTPRHELDGETQAHLHGYEELPGIGYLQFTGRDVRQDLSERMGIDLVNHPELLGKPEISAKASAIYFDYKGTAELADKGEFLEAYATINPGAFESDEEHIWRAPYNIEQRAKEYQKKIHEIESNRHMTVTDNPLQDIIDDVNRQLEMINVSR